MLSYIYRLMCEFEQQHGMAPNLLYLNPVHLQHLKEGLAEGISLQSIYDLLKMELVVNYDTRHPNVIWSHSAARMAG